MGIKVGRRGAVNISVGSSKVKEVYVGSKLIWVSSNWEKVFQGPVTYTTSASERVINLRSLPKLVGKTGVIKYKIRYSAVTSKYIYYYQSLGGLTGTSNELKSLTDVSDNTLENFFYWSAPSSGSVRPLVTFDNLGSGTGISLQISSGYQLQVKIPVVSPAISVTINSIEIDYSPKETKRWHTIGNLPKRITTGDSTTVLATIPELAALKAERGTIKYRVTFSNVGGSSGGTDYWQANYLANDLDYNNSTEAPVAGKEYNFRLYNQTDQDILNYYKVVSGSSGGTYGVYLSIQGNNIVLRSYRSNTRYDVFMQIDSLELYY